MGRAIENMLDHHMADGQYQQDNIPEMRMNKKSAAFKVILYLNLYGG